MKYPLIIIVLFFSTFLKAQFNDAVAVNDKNIATINKRTNSSVWYNEYSSRYFLFSVYTSLLTSIKAPGDIYTSFNYQARDVNTGAITNGVITAHQNHVFSRCQVASGIQFEFGRKNFFINVKAGMPYSNIKSMGGWSGDIDGSLGIGYLFIQRDDYYYKNKNNLFIVKISCNLQTNYYDSHRLGTINTQNKNIVLLGTTTPDYFTKGQGSSGSYTVQAKTLDIYYGQSFLSIIPQIGISNNPKVNVFNWEIDFSWLIPFHQQSGLDLYFNKNQSYPINENNYFNSSNATFTTI